MQEPSRVPATAQLPEGSSLTRLLRCKRITTTSSALPVGPGPGLKRLHHLTLIQYSLEYSVVIFMNLIGPQQVSKCNRDVSIPIETRL